MSVGVGIAQFSCRFAAFVMNDDGDSHSDSGACAIFPPLQIELTILLAAANSNNTVNIYNKTTNIRKKGKKTKIANNNSWVCSAKLQWIFAQFSTAFPHNYYNFRFFGHIMASNCQHQRRRQLGIVVSE